MSGVVCSWLSHVRGRWAWFGCLGNHQLRNHCVNRMAAILFQSGHLIAHKNGSYIHPKMNRFPLQDTHTYTHTYTHTHAHTSIQDILCQISIWIYWNVDSLLTAMVLKVKKCPKSGYWISVLRFKSCTMKVSLFSRLVGRDFGIQDILCQLRYWIHWKVDYLITAVVLKVKKCPKSEYWISVLRYKSCTMNASVRSLQVRRDFGT